MASTVSAGSAQGLLQGTPYELVVRKGGGAMGEVWEAVNVALDRRVIVKIVRAELASTEVAARLRDEARILAKLDHRNIVRVEHLGTTSDGRPFMVMEKLEGCTLAELCRMAERRVLVPDLALRITAQLLSGLGAAHRAGIVHRDLKPDNVFIADMRSETDFRAVLLDFGVARVLAGSPHHKLPMHLPTEPETIVGTPRFVSPEQVLGQPVDARSDLYGLGVVLFTMVTGRPPFTGTSLAEILQAHALVRPPRPSEIAPQPIPDAVERIILRALEKSPAGRFASAEELARAVDDALGRRAAGDVAGEPREDPATGKALRLLPRTVRLHESPAAGVAPAAAGAARGPKGTVKLESDRRPEMPSDSPPAVRASPPAREPAAAPLVTATEPESAPASRDAGQDREPEVDRLRLAIIFAVALLVAGAVFIAAYLLGRQRTEPAG